MPAERHPLPIGQSRFDCALLIGRRGQVSAGRRRLAKEEGVDLSPQFRPFALAAESWPFKR